jgi:hypothetical protein
MGDVITYKNDKRHCFCQVRLDSGERILISMGSGMLKIYKLFLRWIPIKTIWETGDPKTIVSVLLCEGQIKHPLDAAKDKALTAKSISDLRRMLT